MDTGESSAGEMQTTDTGSQVWRETFLTRMRRWEQCAAEAAEEAGIQGTYLEKLQVIGAVRAGLCLGVFWTPLRLPEAGS